MFTLETKAAKLGRVNRDRSVSGACILSRRKCVAPIVIVGLDELFHGFGRVGGTGSSQVEVGGACSRRRPKGATMLADLDLLNRSGKVAGFSP